MARFNQPTKQNITKFMKFFFTSLYPEFQAGAKAVLEEHESLNDRWRLGHTKVFFKVSASVVI